MLAETVAAPAPGRHEAYGALQALRILDRTAKLGWLPTRAYHLRRARALLRSERYGEAAQALDQYLKAGKPSAEVYQARGWARAHTGNYAGALED